MQISNEKLAYSVKEAAIILGIGMTKVYQEIGEGRLQMKKFGRRTLITSEALKEWLNSLPAMGEDGK